LPLHAQVLQPLSLLALHEQAQTQLLTVLPYELALLQAAKKE
jgi:hypothetical protein